MNFKGLNTKTKKLKDQSVKNPKDKKKAVFKWTVLSLIVYSERLKGLNFLY
jgi:hypothetical protein